MATLIPAAQQWFDNNGDPLALGKIYFYEAGTTTPKDTYTTQAGDTENANPVILNSAGRADIWGTGSYKIAIYTSADVLVKTLDDVTLSAETVTVHESAVISGTLLTQDYDIGFFVYNCTIEGAGFECDSGDGNVSLYLSDNKTSASGTVISGASSVDVDTDYTTATLTANNTVVSASPKRVVLKCNDSNALTNLTVTLKISKVADE